LRGRFLQRILDAWLGLARRRLLDDLLLGLDVGLRAAEIQHQCDGHDHGDGNAPPEPLLRVPIRFAIALHGVSSGAVARVPAARLPVSATCKGYDTALDHAT